MPVYEIPLPVGAKNIQIELEDSTRIPVEPSYYRKSKDGDIPIVAIFGGDKFVGKVLEGHWYTLFKDKAIPYAKIDGTFEAHLKSTADGSQTYMVYASRGLLFKGMKLTVKLRTEESSVPNDTAYLDVVISDTKNTWPDRCLMLRLRLTTSGAQLQVGWRTDAGWQPGWNSSYSTTGIEGTFEIELGDTLVVKCDGDVVLEESMWMNWPLYLMLRLGSACTTEVVAYCDYITTQLPEFKVLYDLDADAVRGLGDNISTVAWDLSGSGNHGTIHGAKFVETLWGRGLEFDGVDDYVNTLSPSAELTGAFSAITVEAVVNVEKTDTFACIARRDVTWDVGAFTLEIDRYSKRATFACFDLDPRKVYSTSDVADTGWHHVVGTWDGSHLRIFVDGVLEGEESTSDTIEARDAPIYIGGGSSSLALKGQIALVRIYKRALSTEEICHNYEHPDDPVRDGLVLEYRWDDEFHGGDVVVYDTLGEKDESKWQRVFNPGHEFMGDCVTENGLVRVKVLLERKTKDIIQFRTWDGEWILCYRVQSEDWKDTLAVLERIERLTPDEAVLLLRLSNKPEGDKESVYRLIVRRGRPPELHAVEGKTRLILFLSHEFTFDSTNDKFRKCDLDSVYHEYLLNSGDNFVVTKSQTTEEATFLGASRDVWLYKMRVAHIENVDRGVAIWPCLIKWPFVKEAEECTLIGGATIDTSLTDDSGDSVKLSAQYDGCKFSLTAGQDIPIGRYFVVIRAKSSVGVTKDLGITVWNVQEERHVSCPPGEIGTTPGTEWCYLSIVADIDDYCDGDDIVFQVRKLTTEANDIWVDYIALVPVANVLIPFAQDVAHNFLRRVTLIRSLTKR